jgi:hypothetical protein
VRAAADRARPGGRDRAHDRRGHTDRRDRAAADPLSGPFRRQADENGEVVISRSTRPCSATWPAAPAAATSTWTGSAVRPASSAELRGDAPRGGPGSAAAIRCSRTEYASLRRRSRCCSSRSTRCWCCPAARAGPHCCAARLRLAAAPGHAPRHGAAARCSSHRLRSRRSRARQPPLPRGPVRGRRRGVRGRAARWPRVIPELHYNLGTALLRTGRQAEAEEHFARALQSVEPDLRQRTYYNLGNRYLEAARAGPPDGARFLDAAAEAYRNALRLDPRDVDAKWNLELALREQAAAAALSGLAERAGPAESAAGS